MYSNSHETSEFTYKPLCNHNLSKFEVFIMFGYFRKSRIDKRASKNHRNQTAIHRQAPRSAYCIYLYDKSKLVPSVFKSDKIVLYRTLSVASYYICQLMSARQIKKFVWIEILLFIWTQGHDKYLTNLVL